MTILLVYKIKLCFNLNCHATRNKGWSLTWLSAISFAYILKEASYKTVFIMWLPKTFGNLDIKIWGYDTLFVSQNLVNILGNIIFYAI